VTSPECPGRSVTLSLGAIIGHHIGTDSSGGLISLVHPTGSSAWWGGVQDAFFSD
jgi:hypothetical protein